jgi:hypothetical protein
MQVHKVYENHSKKKPFIWYSKAPQEKHARYLKRKTWAVKHGQGTDEGLVKLVTNIAVEKFGLQGVVVMSTRLWYLDNVMPTWPDFSPDTWHVDQPQCWGQSAYDRKTNLWLAPVPPTGKKVVLLALNIDRTIPPYKVGVRSTTSAEHDDKSYTEYVFSVGFNDAYILCGDQATIDMHNYVFAGKRKFTLVAGLFANH